MHIEARHLRDRLNDPSQDIEVAALEAVQLFAGVNWEAQARWLGFELQGYEANATSQRLHELFGVPMDARLVGHVAAYRAQPGSYLSSTGAPATFSHFFVEPIRELIATRDRVRAAGVSGDLVLSFGPQPGLGSYPNEAEFSPDVFERVLLGFRATLHLQLGFVIHPTWP